MKDTRKVKRSGVQRRDAKSVVRLMGWENAVTGLGKLNTDKRLGSTFYADLVSQEVAEELWRGDDMLARAVEALPDEMLREGYEICIPEDKELAEEIENEHERLNTVEVLREAMYYARAFGGGGIVVGSPDGLPLSKPLDLKRIKKLEEFSARSPRELIPESYYSNPKKPKYGQVATYRLVPLDTPPGADLSGFDIIHETRIIRIDGIKTSRRIRMRNVHAGWDDSIFVRLAQLVNDYQHAWQGMAILMQDFAPSTLKIKGLAKVLASQTTTANTVQKRAAALELGVSIARVRLLDAEEEYKRDTVSVAGLGDLLDKFASRVAAAIKMPVTLLMGVSPGGLNATGDSDVRWYYDQVKAQQKRILRPALKALTEMIFWAKEGPHAGEPPKKWSLKFSPLWQPSEKEREETRKITADRDAVYINAQVVTPEEIAKSRFGGEGYSTETEIDLELRDKMQEDEEHQTGRLGQPNEHDQREREAQVKAAEGIAKTAGKSPPAKGKPPFMKKDDTLEVMDFDPDQPRDEQGQFGEGGEGGESYERDESEGSFSLKVGSTVQVEVAKTKWSKGGAQPHKVVGITKNGAYWTAHAVAPDGARRLIRLQKDGTWRAGAAKITGVTEKK